ncbi:MAG: MATE family efflux transporter, partial [Halocynthiibacter sp.]
GWPIGLTNLAETGAFTAVAIMMGWLGAIELAAHGVALQIAATTFMIQVGISNATTIRAGRAYGKHDPEALKSIGYGALGLSICVASFTTLLFFSQGEVLVGAFLDKTDPDFDIILKTGVILLYMAAIFQLADGIQVIALGALRGIQDTTIPMIYAALSYWGLGMVASYVLGFVFNWGGIGVWSGLIIGLAGAGLLMTLRYFRRLRLLT